MTLENLRQPLENIAKPRKARELQEIHRKRRTPRRAKGQRGRGSVRPPAHPSEQNKSGTFFRRKNKRIIDYGKREAAKSHYRDLFGRVASNPMQALIARSKRRPRSRSQNRADLARPEST